MRYISAAYAVTRCPSVCVCVSVTFVSCVKTNKDIIEIFSPSGSQAIRRVARGGGAWVNVLPPVVSSSKFFYQTRYVHQKVNGSVIVTCT